MTVSTCFFSQVELLDWKLEDISKKKDGGILRQTFKSGSGYSSPNEEALVESKNKSKVLKLFDIKYNNSY